MSAYLIACVQWHDPDATAAYGKLVVDSMQPYGGKYLARGAPAAALEGDQAPKRLAIVEFPTVAHARQWHASPEYAPVKQDPRGARDDVLDHRHGSDANELDAGSDALTQRVETLIIGAGQAGLAMSFYLKQLGLEHLVLERAQVADRWRTQRWDSLMFQFPNWGLQLPGHAYVGDDPDGFSHKDAVRRFIEDYAANIKAPVSTGVDVVCLRPAVRKDHYLVSADGGDYEARNVIIATGPYQRPLIPRLSGQLPSGVHQLHASEYRNPEALPEGAVLVIGSAASGCQIADELLEAGRRVYLSVGRHDRLPRRYRGKDVLHWMQALGLYDSIVETAPENLRSSRFLVTGVRGGYDMDLRRSAARGMALVGHLIGAGDGRLFFKPDLEESLRHGDEAFAGFVRAVDEHVKLLGPQALEAPGDSGLVPVVGPVSTTQEIDLSGKGIRSVIWATGYVLDFSWIDLPIFDERRELIQHRGVTAAPGIYFLGLKRQHKFKSSLLSGVGEDAAYLAERLAHSS